MINTKKSILQPKLFTLMPVTALALLLSISGGAKASSNNNNKDINSNNLINKQSNALASASNIQLNSDNSNNSNDDDEISYNYTHDYETKSQPTNINNSNSNNINDKLRIKESNKHIKQQLPFINAVAVSTGRQARQNSVNGQEHSYGEIAPNFRDLGGIRTTDGRTVKYNMLYRSSRLNHLTIRAYKYMLNRLHLYGDIDLRVSGDANYDPSSKKQLFDSAIVPPKLNHGKGGEVVISKQPDIDFHNYPALKQIYGIQFVQACHNAIISILNDTKKGAVVYHGNLGIFRTGYLTAIILSALNVPKSTIYSNFEESLNYIKTPIQQARLKSDLDNFYSNVNKRYGSMKRYLQVGIGLSPQLIQELQNRLLTTNSSQNNSNPDNSNPDNSNPDNGNPDNSNPDNSNPDNSNPDNGNPNNSNPDNSNPDNGSSNDNSSKGNGSTSNNNNGGNDDNSQDNNNPQHTNNTPGFPIINNHNRRNKNGDWISANSYLNNAYDKELRLAGIKDHDMNAALSRAQQSDASELANQINTQNMNASESAEIVDNKLKTLGKMQQGQLIHSASIQSLTNSVSNRNFLNSEAKSMAISMYNSESSKETSRNSGEALVASDISTVINSLNADSYLTSSERNSAINKLDEEKNQADNQLINDTNANGVSSEISSISKSISNQNNDENNENHSHNLNSANNQINHALQSADNFVNHNSSLNSAEKSALISQLNSEASNTRGQIGNAQNADNVNGLINSMSSDINNVNNKAGSEASINNNIAASQANSQINSSRDSAINSVNNNPNLTTVQKSQLDSEINTKANSDEILSNNMYNNKNHDISSGNISPNSVNLDNFNANTNSLEPNNLANGINNQSQNTSQSNQQSIDSLDASQKDSQINNARNSELTSINSNPNLSPSQKTSADSEVNSKADSDENLVNNKYSSAKNSELRAKNNSQNNNSKHNTSINHINENRRNQLQDISKNEQKAINKIASNRFLSYHQKVRKINQIKKAANRAKSMVNMQAKQAINKQKSMENNYNAFSPFYDRFKDKYGHIYSPLTWNKFLKICQQHNVPINDSRLLYNNYLSSWKNIPYMNGLKSKLNSMNINQIESNPNGVLNSILVSHILNNKNVVLQNINGNKVFKSMNFANSNLQLSKSQINRTFKPTNFVSSGLSQSNIKINSKSNVNNQLPKTSDKNISSLMFMFGLLFISLSMSSLDINRKQI